MSKMTPAELSAASFAIVRTHVGWQAKIARELGVQPRSVRRWMSEDAPIPDEIAERLHSMRREAEEKISFPRGEWLVGYDDESRRMIAHLQHPRFTCRVIMCEPDGSVAEEDEPANILSGVTYVDADPAGECDVILCEVAWIDDPDPGEVTHLMRAAYEAFEEHEDKMLDIDLADY